MFLMRGSKQREALQDREIRLQKIHDIETVKDDEGVITDYIIESEWEEGHGKPETHSIKSIHANPKYMMKIDGIPVRTFSDMYTPVQDSDVQSMVYDALEEQHIPILNREFFCPSRYSTFGVLTTEIGKAIIKSRPDELFDYHVIWSNSLDGSHAVYVRGAWERVICANGLIATHSLIENKIVHIQKERDPIHLLGGIMEMAKSIIGLRQKEIEFFNRMDTEEMTMNQILWVLNKLKFNKWESQRLTKHGLSAIWNKGEIVEVSLCPVSQFFRDIVVNANVTDHRAMTEWAFFNAISNLSREVKDMDRQMELLTRSLALIVKSRYMASEIEAAIF